MAKYLIKSCPERVEYVQNYLIPSMLNQGIKDEDVTLFIDKEKRGCLETAMRAFAQASNDDGGIWYMQDDVIICHDFKERTEQHDDGIVCGYCYELDDKKRYIGKVKPKEYWYSFPCIRIPNKIARKCANWFYNYVLYNNQYGVWIRSKKYDDTMFDLFMQDYYPLYEGLNLKPNLVDHIDYLIGGSVVNKIRPEKETHAAYFEDLYLVRELEAIMKKNETCMYCVNRHECEKYKNWLNDKSNIHPLLVKNCNKYEEEKFDRNIEKCC